MLPLVRSGTACTSASVRRGFVQLLGSVVKAFGPLVAKSPTATVDAESVLDFEDSWRGSSRSKHERMPGSQSSIDELRGFRRVDEDEGDDEVPPEGHSLEELVYGDLFTLVNDKDPEQDIFWNLTHLQVHRRARALSRLSARTES